MLTGLTGHITIGRPSFVRGCSSLEEKEIPHDEDGKEASEVHDG